MKKFPIWIVALLFICCSPYDNNGSADAGKNYTGSIDDTISRVYMDEGLSLHFHSVDAINLFTTTASNKYVFIGNSGDTSGEFVREGVLNTSGSSLGRTYAI